MVKHLFPDRIKKINLMNKLGDGANEIPLEYTNLYRWQGTELSFHNDGTVFSKQRIADYFAQLGEFLSNSQDDIFIDMHIDECGISKITIDFSSIG